MFKKLRRRIRRFFSNFACFGKGVFRKRGKNEFRGRFSSNILVLERGTKIYPSTVRGRLNEKHTEKCDNVADTSPLECNKKEGSGTEYSTSIRDSGNHTIEVREYEVNGRKLYCDSTRKYDYSLHDFESGEDKTPQICSNCKDKCAYVELCENSENVRIASEIQKIDRSGQTNKKCSSIGYNKSHREGSKLSSAIPREVDKNDLLYIFADQNRKTKGNTVDCIGYLNNSRESVYMTSISSGIFESPIFQCSGNNNNTSFYCRDSVHRSYNSKTCKSSGVSRSSTSGNDTKDNIDKLQKIQVEDQISSSKCCRKNNHSQDFPINKPPKLSAQEKSLSLALLVSNPRVSVLVSKFNQMSDLPTTENRKLLPKKGVNLEAGTTQTPKPLAIRHTCSSKLHNISRKNSQDIEVILPNSQVMDKPHSGNENLGKVNKVHSRSASCSDNVWDDDFDIPVDLSLEIPQCFESCKKKIQSNSTNLKRFMYLVRELKVMLETLKTLSSQLVLKKPLLHCKIILEHSKIIESAIKLVDSDCYVDSTSARGHTRRNSAMSTREISYMFEKNYNAERERRVSSGCCNSQLNVRDVCEPEYKTQVEETNDAGCVMNPNRNSNIGTKVDRHSSNTLSVSHNHGNSLSRVSGFATGNQTSDFASSIYRADTEMDSPSIQGSIKQDIMCPCLENKCNSNHRPEKDFPSDKILQDHNQKFINYSNCRVEDRNSVFSVLGKDFNAFEDPLAGLVSYVTDLRKSLKFCINQMDDMVKGQKVAIT